MALYRSLYGPGVVSTLLAVLLTACNVCANTETPVTSTDGGGTKSTGLNVAIDSSISAGGTIASSGNVTLKGGYAGQLYDLTSLQVTAFPTSVNENATRQLNAVALFDDDTTGQLQGTPTWSIVVGPLQSIDATGLATASNVYEDALATARAVSESATGTIALLVLNIDPDDYGTYAGDGLPDDWQVIHFGVDNPDAAPGLDPDGDSQTNAFEYIVGTVPTNDSSLFELFIDQVVGVSTQVDIVFHPAFTDRAYEIQYLTDLVAGMWTNVVSYQESTNGTARTIRDLAATNAAAFYRVRVQYSP
jgi:hypothetical protein